jgi:hypothetical protein
MQGLKVQQVKVVSCAAELAHDILVTGLVALQSAKPLPALMTLCAHSERNTIMLIRLFQTAHSTNHIFADQQTICKKKHLSLSKQQSAMPQQKCDATCGSWP